jgi:N-acyl-L-homoserine lactone synthetase
LENTVVAVAFNGPSFAERLVDFLDLAEVRRLAHPDDLEAVFRLRYDAYVREGAIPRDFSRRFTDGFDRQSNVWIFGVYLDGRLASSIRVHVASPENSSAPATAVFPDLLMPEIDKGRTIVDPTRFVADEHLARQNPELPYATVRLGLVASEHFKADIGLATVRLEHRAFYKRLFGLEPLGEPRNYPNLAKPICLMGIDYPQSRRRILERYPYLRSTEEEREMLFGHVPSAPITPFGVVVGNAPSIRRDVRA